MDDSARQFLVRLLDTPSPTGWEMPGQRVWAAQVGPHADEVQSDAYGNTWAVLNGRDGASTTLMLAAHADEIGFIIRHVTAEGFLRIDRIGGSDVATARGRRLRLLGSRGEVRGVIGNTAIHLRRDNAGDEKAPKVHELFVDVGASSREEVAALGLRVGTPAVYADEAEFVGGRLLVGRALDNRIGGFILAEVLRRLSAQGSRPAVNLVFLNAIQEEIGGHGATMATHRLRPDAAICLDVTHATDSPGIDHSVHGEVRLGGGPAVTHGTSNHPLLVQRLVDAAEGASIPLQHEAASRYTGTDTDSIFIIRDGVPSALVSLPLRYMHSVVETAHLGDLDHTIELLVSLVNKLGLGDRFAVSLV